MLHGTSGSRGNGIRTFSERMRIVSAEVLAGGRAKIAAALSPRPMRKNRAEKRASASRAIMRKNEGRKRSFIPRPSRRRSVARGADILNLRQRLSVTDRFHDH